MAYINEKALEREEQAIYDDDTVSVADKNKLINQLHRDARADFEEQQREEYRDQFGW